MGLKIVNRFYTRTELARRNIPLPGIYLPTNGPFRVAWLAPFHEILFITCSLHLMIWPKAGDLCKIAFVVFEIDKCMSRILACVQRTAASNGTLIWHFDSDSQLRRIS